MIELGQYADHQFMRKSTPFELIKSKKNHFIEFYHSHGETVNAKMPKIYPSIDAFILGTHQDGIMEYHSSFEKYIFEFS